MTVQFKQPVLDRDLPSNPKAHGAADAYDPRLPWDGKELTAYQKSKQVEFERRSKITRSKAQQELEEATLKIAEVAPPFDARGVLNSTMSDVERVRQTAAPEIEALAAECAEAAKEKLEFAEREHRPYEVELIYDPEANRAALWTTALFLLLGESGTIAAFLGPFSPGGRVQAFAYALVGSVVLATLATVVGYFGLRAWSVSSALMRIGARATVAIGLVTIKLVLVFITAYRTSLESGRPISEWSRHVSLDAVWLILISLVIVGFTIWKARGGSMFGFRMPYSTYWGESAIDQRYRCALANLGTAKEHYRDQIIQGVYEETSRELEEKVADAERQLIERSEEALIVEQQSVRHDQTVRNARTDTKADLDLYAAAVVQEKAGAIVAQVTPVAPVLPDAGRELGEALARAATRLMKLRDAVTDIGRPLGEARAEALLRLDAAFRTELEIALGRLNLRLEDIAYA